jgi:CRISPR-associated endonuclease Csn1
MKKILGLDLGTASIGWALVNEAEYDNEINSIIKAGVRVNPLSSDDQSNFEEGKSITLNAERTLKRSARRNLQRYKLRRDELIKILEEAGIIDSNLPLTEEGNFSTFKTYENRALAATERIDLYEFAKVLLMINKKRGYKSSRKVQNQDEGQLIDGMGVAIKLYEEGITPGHFVYSILKAGKKIIPDFYRSDLRDEFERIWNFQAEYYPDILTEEFKELVFGKSLKETSFHFREKFGLYTADNKGKDKRLQKYRWRCECVEQQMPIDVVAAVFCDVNSNINASSGYLGAISDRSKELYFNKQTIGQYLWGQIQNNSHMRLKGQVFYRQDYLDEFEVIWEQQAKHHPKLTNELKSVVRDVVIFYQRRLKSQKALLSFCEFESKEVVLSADGKMKKITFGARVCPKSSPIFQVFKIWSILNNIEVKDLESKTRFKLEIEQKQLLFDELNYLPKLSAKDALKLLFDKHSSSFELNYKDLEGNRTNAAILEKLYEIVNLSGHEITGYSKLNSANKVVAIMEILSSLGVNSNILDFNPLLEGEDFQKQPLYLLWHLLYSYEGDNSKTGNDSLLQALKDKYGFSSDFAVLLSNISFSDDYSDLSSKAIRKILPHLMDGLTYDKACLYAGYNHSKSLTADESKNRTLEPMLELLPKNSLRNPVVEKILNQMVNLINGVVNEYGKPDEIRIELARELKKSADERKRMTEAINKSKSEHEEYREILTKEFGLRYVSRNDLIRYKLYKELEFNGYKTLYTNTYISQDKLFSKEFDIEHIIPQARLFDDSFSNKTLEVRSANIEKGDATAYDYVYNKYGEEGLVRYKSVIDDLYRKDKISRTKRTKLLMTGDEIPNDFIERDLRDSQYIAKKAKQMLEKVFRTVTTTTGSITDKLREDWQLINVMQELNWERYNVLGLTYYEANNEGKPLPRISGWSKRDDHRHHTMDAITVAFTKRSHIQYLNNMNARSDRSSSIYGIEKKELFRDDKGKLRFKPPMPLETLRAEVKRHLEHTLVSIKAKNKVVTTNVNKTKKRKGHNTQIALTPRGQLHLETVYGKINRYKTTKVKVGGSFNYETIQGVANKKHREALLKRLSDFDNDTKKAFTGKNSPEKNPIYIDEHHSAQLPSRVKMVEFENVYTIRKEVSPDLNIDKVIDVKVKDRLKERLSEYGGDSKKAFTNLDENPIWLNESKGIKIKRVTISGISNAEALHEKRNKYGELVLDENGYPIPVDFVNTGNNHHVAIYADSKGDWHEKVVSLYEAVVRANQGLPAVDKLYNSHEGWSFQFSMKQNEYFIFPNESQGFYPKEIDLLNQDNYSTISPNLFRVQKFTNKDYFFRHHLETTVQRRDSKGKPIDEKPLKGVISKRINSLSALRGVVKVRINHLGIIVQVGEY